MAHDVFVSHSVKDKAIADAIVARLEADSVTCWIAPRDVVPGADWGESIIDAIESSRIMILIFSRNADASPQIKREVERAVNKGVYIIPFRIDEIPPSKSLEYFISTSQWMDAFSPPLERHLDNLAKTVKAVLKTPPLPAADVPAQPERPSISKPPIRPSRRKSTLIAITIAALVIVGGAGWYLVQKKKAPPETPAVTPIGTPTPVRITPVAVTPIPTLVPIPVQTPSTPPPSANMINDGEVRDFVTSFFRAEERGDVEYMLSQYGDSFRRRPERHDKASRRDQLDEFLKQWPVRSFTVGDIRVVHSDIADRVTVYFEYRFLYRDPASGRSDSGRPSQEWVISKTSGALKIVSRNPTAHGDLPTPSPLPTQFPTLTTPQPSRTSSAPVAQSAGPTVTGEENTYSGQVGSSEATFRLRFGPGRRVSGTYTQNGRTFRLEGQNPTGKLLLDEYTDAQLTARIELTRKNAAGDIRWEGTMHNTSSDNRSFLVWFSRSGAPQTPPPTSSAQVTQSAGPTVTGEENTYSGQVGSSEATFRLRFGPGRRVSGTYTQNGSTFRLEGQNPPGKLLLEEYTGAQLTARIELTRKNAAGDIRWEGTMHNTPPDNRSFPVWFSRQRK